MSVPGAFVGLAALVAAVAFHVAGAEAPAELAGTIAFAAYALAAVLGDAIAPMGRSRRDGATGRRR